MHPAQEKYNGTPMAVQLSSQFQPKKLKSSQRELVKK